MHTLSHFHAAMGRDSITHISTAGAVFIDLPVYIQYKYTKKPFFSVADHTEMKSTLSENALEQSAM